MKQIASLLAGLCLVINISFARKPELHFVPNRHQWEPQVRYKAEIPSGSFFLTDQGFVYSFYNQKDLMAIHDLQHEEGKMFTDVMDMPVNCFAYRMNFVNAQLPETYQEEDKRSFYYNYFLGSNIKNWAGKVPVYGKLTQKNIYAGVDVAVYSTGSALKYDFIVAPYSDPSQILLGFEGVLPVIDKDGALVLNISFNEVKEARPYAYQDINGKRIEVPCFYRQLSDGTIAFSLPEGYNKDYTLVIDPTLVFGTFSGCTGNTYGFSACYDNDGSLYAGGENFTGQWPVTAGSFQTTFGNGIDCGINKYTPDGTALVYSTYYGGSGSDLPNNMVTNSNGELAIMGSTTSYDLPVTTGCFQNTSGGAADFLIAHFSADGSSLIGATYVGGSDQDCQNYGTSSNYGDQYRGEVYYDTDGNILIAGSSSSSDFPVSPNAFQGANGGGQDGVIFKLNPDCSQLLYSTYLGGSAADACFALVTNSAGNIVTCGGTLSSNFPTTTGVLFPAFQGSTDGFVSILNASGSLLQSTFLGTAVYDHAFKVQVDQSDQVYVLGQTDGAYPITAGVYNIADGNIFIDKLNEDLSASEKATRMGNPQSGFSRFVPTAFMVDYCHNLYLCGFQSTSSLPVTPDAFQATGGTGFWLGELNADWSDLEYGTFYGNNDHVDGGSSRFDPNGVVYHSVCTIDPGFPTTSGAYAPNILASGWDVGSFKFDFEPVAIQAEISIDINSNDSVCLSQPILFDNSSMNATAYHWDFGDGTSSAETEPSHVYEAPGTYQVTLEASNFESCNMRDTAYLTVYVLDTLVPSIVVKDTIVCNNVQQVTLRAGVDNLEEGIGVSYTWQPADAILTGGNDSVITANIAASQDYIVTVTYDIGNGLCSFQNNDTIHVGKSIPEEISILTPDTSVCIGKSVDLDVSGTDAYSYTWYPSGGMQDANKKETRVTLFQSTTYTLTGSDSIGCTSQDTIRIDVVPCCNLVIANAFSPNEDGVNDVFYLQTQESVVLVQFSIFNRWGETVFDAATLQDGWDGYLKGTPADGGVYFYYLKYKCLGSDEVIVKRGDITLLR